MKILVAIFIVYFGLSNVAADDLDPFVNLSGHAADPATEKLRFNNTQTFAQKYLVHTRGRPKYLPDNWRTLVAAAEPPKNSSQRTRAELDYLLQLQEDRTEEDIERIKTEIKLVGFVFDEMTYPEITDLKNRPRTAALAKAANFDITIVMFQAKQHFNRVRPHFLEPRIKPAIPVPDHPAYPSGHSTQAYMWAFLLCELVKPERHSSILAGAKLIATDRELAGVHYPSDTALGRGIARRVVDLWMENPKFRTLVEAARTEW